MFNQRHQSFQRSTLLLQRRLPLQTSLVPTFKNHSNESTTLHQSTSCLPDVRPPLLLVQPPRSSRPRSSWSRSQSTQGHRTRSPLPSSVGGSSCSCFGGLSSQVGGGRGEEAGTEEGEAEEGCRRSDKGCSREGEGERRTDDAGGCWWEFGYGGDGLKSEGEGCDASVVSVWFHLSLNFLSWIFEDVESLSERSSSASSDELVEQFLTRRRERKRISFLATAPVVSHFRASSFCSALVRSRSSA